MSQTKIASTIEVVLGTLVGYLIAMWVQTIVFPIFGIHINLTENAIIAGIFTAISVARGFVTRRFFNWLYVRRILV